MLLHGMLSKLIIPIYVGLLFVSYTHAHVQPRTCACMRACAGVNGYTYTQTHTNACMHARTQTPCLEALVKMFGEKPGSQHWGLCIPRDPEITLMLVGY